MTTFLSPLRGFNPVMTTFPGTAVPGFIRLPLRANLNVPFGAERWPLRARLGDPS